MRFDKRKDPAAVSAKEGSRYAVAGVAIVMRGEDAFLAATDGHALTFVRAFFDPDDDAGCAGRVYPAAAFTAARKAARRQAEARLTVNGTAYVVADGMRSEFARAEVPFPDAEAIVPKGGPVGILRLNAELLARIQRALGADAVEIHVHGMAADGREVDPCLPLTIAPLYIGGGGEDDGSRGFLMPVRGD
jgi:hypothetical protein